MKRNNTETILDEAPVNKKFIKIHPYIENLSLDTSISMIENKLGEKIFKINLTKHFITKSGKIIRYSNRRGRISFLKPQLNIHGYYIIGFQIQGKKKMFFVHRLLATIFIPNPENKPEVNHINGIRTDNNIKNLEWVTRSENQLHAYKTGLDNKKGERNSAAKLKEKDILEIRLSKDFGTVLAKKYKVSHSTIYSIKNNKRWKHI